MLKFLGFMVALSATTVASAAPKAVTLADYAAAKCEAFDATIVGKLRHNTFEAYADSPLHADDDGSPIARSIPANERFVIKTKTFAFTGPGESGDLYMLRKGKEKIKLFNGFETTVWVFEESKKCEDLWAEVLKTMQGGLK